MSYLIDSDWVIDALKGRVTARNLFQTLALGLFAISLMTYGEVFEGSYCDQTIRAFHKHVTRQNYTRLCITLASRVPGSDATGEVAEARWGLTSAIL